MRRVDQRSSERLRRFAWRWRCTAKRRYAISKELDAWSKKQREEQPAHTGSEDLTPDIYDPALNPLDRDVLAHYGVIALPCRVGDPDRKGKVEADVGHAQKTPLKGLRFETLEAAQAYLDRWETHWADTRIHGTTKRQVAVMFAEERPALGPLPLEPFRYYRFGDRTVHLNGYVEVEGAYYGAPPGWLGQRVQVQWNDLHVRLLAPKTGQLLRVVTTRSGPRCQRRRAECVNRVLGGRLPGRRDSVPRGCSKPRRRQGYTGGARRAERDGTCSGKYRPRRSRGRK